MTLWLALVLLPAYGSAATAPLLEPAAQLPAMGAAARELRNTIARAAVAQVGVTLVYDSSYRTLRYPGGDPPLERGVCTDVVVRAFRAIGVDLQVAVHEDMRSHFELYPKLWDLHRPDRNIDHRRVPNLMKFFERLGKSLAIDDAYTPGDVVAWRLASGLTHIGVVAEQRADGGRHHLVVHNIGQGTRQEDVLHAYEKLGHYRW